MNLRITETHQSVFSSIDLYRIKTITVLSRNSTKWIWNSHNFQCLAAFLDIPCVYTIYIYQIFLVQLVYRILLYKIFKAVIQLFFFFFLSEWLVLNFWKKRQHEHSCEWAAMAGWNTEFGAQRDADWLVYCIWESLVLRSLQTQSKMSRAVLHRELQLKWNHQELFADLLFCAWKEVMQGVFSGGIMDHSVFQQ